MKEWLKREEGEALPYSMSSNYVEEKMDFKNHHVAAIILMADSSSSHQWIISLMNKVWWGTGYWNSLGLPPHKILFTYKWEKKR